MLNLNSKNRWISVIAIIILITSHIPDVFGASNNAKQDIVVKDYTWKSYGTGRAAILKDITLKNLSLTDYKNIEIEIDFYSKAGTPRGSIRGTVQDKLPAGSEVTYNNIKFGIMNTSLEDSTAKVVSAEESGAGPISFIGRSLIVKDVKFSDAQYGTESFIEEITLENKTDQNYKDVKIKISDLGVQGAKVGYEGYVNKIKINKVIPANSTVTLKNINIGFAHPDSKKKLVVVSEATPVSTKELKYLYGKQKDSIEIKQQGVQVSEEEKRLSLVERYRQTLKEKNIKINEQNQTRSTSDQQEEGDMNFSLVEEVEEEVIIKKEEKKITTLPSPETSKEIKLEKAENKTTSAIEFEEDIDDQNKFIAANNAVEENDEIIVNSSNEQNEFSPDEEIVITDETENNEKNNKIADTKVASNSDKQSASENDFSNNELSADDSSESSSEIGEDIIFTDENDLETASIRNYDVSFENEVPLPQHDLVVKKFTWGSGIPGTLGKLRKLILENISGIAYTDIDILVEYFSPNGIPLGSSQFKLKEQVIEPKETKEFKDIDVGLVQLIPSESHIKISIRSAKDI